MVTMTSSGCRLGAQSITTVRAGGSSIIFSTAFAACSVIRSASSTSTICHRPCEGARPAIGTLIRANFRIDSVGPPTGAITALARLPSRIRASTNGRSSVSSRPTLAAMRCARSATCSGPWNATAVRSRRPSRSTKISRGPFTSTSVTRGSSKSGCSGPKPNSSAQMASRSASFALPRAATRTRSRSNTRREGSA